MVEGTDSCLGEATRGRLLTEGGPAGKWIQVLRETLEHGGALGSLFGERASSKADLGR